MHLYFFIPVSGKGCRCYYRLFLFFFCWYLPFSVQAGLQIFTYLCDLFCFVLLFFFSEPLYLKLSVFLLTLSRLVFVTCVLALCKDGAKQISNLPFIFYWRINCDIQSWWPKIQFPMHVSSTEAKLWILLLGRLSCHIRAYEAKYVTIPTVIRAKWTRLLAW